MEASGSVLVVGVQEHLEGVVLNVGVTHHLLTDGVVVGQLRLHLENKRTLGQSKQPLLAEGFSRLAVTVHSPACQIKNTFNE